MSQQNNGAGQIRLYHGKNATEENKYQKLSNILLRRLIFSFYWHISAQHLCRFISNIGIEPSQDKSKSSFLIYVETMRCLGDALEMPWSCLDGADRRRWKAMIIATCPDNSVQIIFRKSGQCRTDYHCKYALTDIPTRTCKWNFNFISGDCLSRRQT